MPTHGTCWQAASRCRRRIELRNAFRESAEKATDTTSALQPLRKLYRDRLLVLAGMDLASTVENEPVLPFVNGR